MCGSKTGLRWRDIDFDGATAIITCQLQQYDGHLIMCPATPARTAGPRWRGQGSGRRAHPGRQVSRPARADLDLNENRLSGTVPAKRRNAHMMVQLGSGHPAMPRSPLPIPAR